MEVGPGSRLLNEYVHRKQLCEEVRAGLKTPRFVLSHNHVQSNVVVDAARVSCDGTEHVPDGVPCAV